MLCKVKEQVKIYRKASLKVINSEPKLFVCVRKNCQSLGIFGVTVKKVRNGK
jgi:hypothetical protein